MKNLAEGTTFEKARRWSLVVAICSIALLVILTVLEAWGAIDFTEVTEDWDSYYSMGESTIWGKLQDSLGIIAGFGFAVIVMVLFVLPRKKD